MIAFDVLIRDMKRREFPEQERLPIGIGNALDGAADDRCSQFGAFPVGQPQRPCRFDEFIIADALETFLVGHRRIPCGAHLDGDPAQVLQIGADFDLACR